MSQLVLTESIHNYLVEINRHPVLSAEDEFTIAERYYKARNIDDAHKLVISNLRYVVRIAFEFRNYGMRMADLIQEGNIGLMHAVKKFDPGKGFRLITYATWWIRSSIQEFILKTKGLVRRNVKALKKGFFYKKENGAHQDEINAQNDLSLNVPVAGGTATHLDLLCDAGPNQEERYASMEENAHVRQEVESAMGRLNDRERFIIEKRVMAEEPASLNALGEKLGLTRERVRQIETQALKKLKSSLA
ncbi:MAG: sigma-70 family RNA polymerase sigma factor [Deltaproteobacteria bacterium]|nr:sigma-70 family RNA polymerase sigma factor [Deltaproteobacteria bacterium]